MLSLSCSAIASSPPPPSATWGAARIFRTWFVNTSTPSPVMKPVITARERKLARKARRKAEDEEDRRAEHGQGEGVLQPQRIPGRGEGHQGGPDQGGHRRVRAGHQVTRARKQREDDQRDDGRVQAGHGRQAGHLGVADVQRDHQGGQGDPGHRLARDVGPRDALEPCQRTRPTQLVRHSRILLAHAPRTSGMRIAPLVEEQAARCA